MTKKGKKRQLSEVEANGDAQIVKNFEKKDEGTPKKKKLKTKQENIAEVKKPELKVSKKVADTDVSSEKSKKKKKKKKNKNKEHDASVTSTTDNKSPEKGLEKSKDSTNNKDSTIGVKRKELFKKKRKEFRENQRKELRQKEGQFSSINNLSIDEMKKKITEIENRGDLSKTALRKLRTLKKKVKIAEMDSSVPEIIDHSTDISPKKSGKRKNDSSDKNIREPENKKFKKDFKKEKHASKEITKDPLFFEDRQGNNTVNSTTENNDKNKFENMKSKNKQNKLIENKKQKFEKKINKVEKSNEENDSEIEDDNKVTNKTTINAYKTKNLQAKGKERNNFKKNSKEDTDSSEDTSNSGQDVELEDKINQYKSSHKLGDPAKAKDSDDDVSDVEVKNFKQNKLGKVSKKQKVNNNEDSSDEQELNVSKNIQKTIKKIKEINVKKLEDGELESDEDEEEGEIEDEEEGEIEDEEEGEIEDEDEDEDEDENEEDDAEDKQEVLKSNKTMLKNKNYKKESSDPEDEELEAASEKKEFDKSPKKQIKKEQPSPDFKKQKQNESEGKKKRYVLFIGNLAYDATTVDLKKHFLTKVEKVKDVRIPLKPKTNVPRGFGYVEVESSIDYEKALSLHGTFIKGRKIKVEYTTSGSKNISRKPEVIHKNKKLHAMRNAGMLAGSKKDSQKRSFRRNHKQFKKNDFGARKPEKAEN